MKFTFSRKAGGLIMLALLTGIFSQGLWAQTVSGVMTRDANMRKGPSADTAIVIILKKGAALTIMGSTTASWLHVKTADGKTGYVSKSFVQITSGSSSDSSAQPSVKVKTGTDEDFEVKDNGDGTVTITRYLGFDRAVGIPAKIGGKPVSAIAANSFAKCGLTAVALPDSVKRIESQAFTGNELTGLSMGKGITHIGNSAFSTNKLTNVVIPDTVIFIGGAAFSDNKLTKVTIPDSVTVIGEHAFSSNNLTNISIGKGVIVIGDMAFAYNHQLTSITLASADSTKLDVDWYGNVSGKTTSGNIRYVPRKYGAVIIGGDVMNRLDIPEKVDGLTVRGVWGFSKKSLARIRIPSTVTYIGENAFSNNDLANISIPDTVKYIGSYAFSENKLTNITVPNSVTYIGGGAFSSNQLTSFNIPRSIVYIMSNTFSNNQLSSLVISDSITEIGDAAFSNNQLTSITIGKGVTYIGDNAFGNNKLTSLVIPDNVTTIGKYAFSKNNLNNITIGFDVGIESNWMSSTFGNNFSEAYLNNGSRGGTYTFNSNNYSWSFTPVDAIPYYDKRLAQNPNDAGTLNLRALEYCRQGNFTKALTDANKALKIRPDNPSTLDTRATAYQSLGRFAEALADWEAAAKLDPDNKDYKTKLAKARWETLNWAVLPQGEFFVQSANATDEDKGFWNFSAKDSTIKTGNRLGVQENTGDDDFYFHFVSLGRGWYKIVNRQGALVLDIEGANDANGASLIASDAKESESQKFRVLEVAEGTYKIYSWTYRAVHTVRSDAENGSTQVSQEVPEGDPKMNNTLWRLIDPMTRLNTLEWAELPAGDFLIQSALEGSDKGFLHLAGSGAGARLELAEKADTEDFYFYFEKIDKGWYELVNRTGFVIGVDAGRAGDGVTLLAYANNDQQNQRFRFLKLSNDFYKIYTFSDKVLRNREGAALTGADLRAGHPDESTALWRLVARPEETPAVAEQEEAASIEAASVETESIEAESVETSEDADPQELPEADTQPEVDASLIEEAESQELPEADTEEVPIEATQDAEAPDAVPQPTEELQDEATP